MKRAFTLIETVIVIALIAILSALLIPKIASGYKDSKEKIINTYNGVEIQVINADTSKVIYQGNKEDFNLENYTLENVEYKNGVVIMYVRSKA